MIKRGDFLRLGRALAVFLAVALWAAARADDAPQSTIQQLLPPAVEKPAPAPAPTAPSAASRSPAALPTEKTSDIQTHWNARRDYLRDHDERRADDEEQRVRTLRDDLAIENLFSVGAALVRESQDALAAGVPVVAVDRCKRAVELAPGLPAAHSCLARALLADSLGNVKPAMGEVLAGMQASLNDPRISRAMAANALAVLLLALLLAGAVYTLILFARYWGLYGHDVHHLFPGGARPWQTRLLAVMIVLLPLFLQAGPVALLFTLLLAVALYATTVEVAVAVSFLALLAASPWVAAGLARVASFPGSAVDVWLVEHGQGTPPEIQRLQKRLEQAPDFAAAFALGHKAKRDGDLRGAELLYRKALETPGVGNPGLAAIHNNLGNVYILQGDTGKALREYQLAVELQENLAAPHFNISRALAMGGVDTLEKVQKEQARARDLDREAVERLTGDPQATAKANKFALDVPLGDALLDPLLAAPDAVAEPVADEVRVHLAWGLPIAIAPALPGVAAALVIVLAFVGRRVRPSGQCERCGREVCKRCDPDARPSESLCAQCVNVFIRRTGVDAAERLRKEHAVAAFHRRRWTLARMLGFVSGAGHVMLGYTLRGMVFLLLTAGLTASVLLWRGLTHDPVAIRAPQSFLRVALTVAGFIAVYAVALRDILHRQRTEGG